MQCPSVNKEAVRGVSRCNLIELYVKAHDGESCHASTLTSLLRAAQTWEGRACYTHLIEQKQFIGENKKIYSMIQRVVGISSTYTT